MILPNILRNIFTLFFDSFNNMIEKTPYYSDGMGKLTPRPKGQDIKPKAFHMDAMAMIWLLETPSERRMLWMLAHYPYLFNTFFISDSLRTYGEKATKQDSPLGKALLVIQSLRSKGYIKQVPGIIAWKIKV